ncbi:hypothetical protein AAVH_01350 [Aphelenchoides avenae]|nr:hypothetical protein AAVH_01350 [Aphelenchus avenae]
MVSMPSTSPMEDYETDGESDMDEAAAENCTSGFMDGGESQEDVKPVDPLQLQQTLREALKIAADQRQRQSMKRTNVKANGATRNQQSRVTQSGLSSSSSAQQQLSSLLPLFGMNVGNSNANFASSYLVNNGTSGTQSSALPEELLQQLFPGFPFNSLAVQQLLATAALSQLANGSTDLKG